jgi:Arc/MetJ-type ribon-helix-helix transcriptional regulator
LKWVHGVAALNVPKITFRADEDLVESVEGLDASKSEVMRDALRAYLAERGTEGPASGGERGSVDALIAERVDELVAERLGGARDVNVNVTVEGGGTAERDDPRARAEPSDTGRRSESRAREQACPQCGEGLSDDHVYCPNCGEKATNRLFCDCGDELRSDWGYCPSCGRRTPSADVLDG